MKIPLIYNPNTDMWTCDFEYQGETVRIQVLGANDIIAIEDDEPYYNVSIIADTWENEEYGHDVDFDYDAMIKYIRTTIQSMDKE